MFLVFFGKGRVYNCLAVRLVAFSYTLEEKNGVSLIMIFFQNAKVLSSTSQAVPLSFLTHI